MCLISDSGLIAGDMVAGIGTILIPPGEGDMIEYVEQLERLLGLDPNLIFPSHGPVIPLPERTLDHYINHRINRHNRVLQAVIQGISNIEEIAKFAYADTPYYNPGLAVDQTLSHLLSHEKVGNVRKSGQQWVRA